MPCWTELDGGLYGNFNRFKRPSNIHIQHFFSPSSIHSVIFKMAAHKSAVVIVLTKLVDSDDEKPRRGKTREWIKRKSESGYFQNIFLELKVEDRMGFKDMFRMSVTNCELLFSQISDLISPNERTSGNKLMLGDERLSLTLRYLATGEFFRSLSYQSRIPWWQYLTS